MNKNIISVSTKYPKLRTDEVIKYSDKISVMRKIEDTIIDNFLLFVIASIRLELIVNRNAYSIIFSIKKYKSTSEVSKTPLFYYVK